MYFTAVRWFNTCGAEHKQRSTVSTPTPTPKVLKLHQFLLDYKKQKELAEGVGAEEESSDAGNSDLSANPTLLPIYLFYCCLFVCLFYFMSGICFTLLVV